MDSKQFFTRFSFSQTSKILTAGTIVFLVGCGGDRDETPGASGTFDGSNSDSFDGGESQSLDSSGQASQASIGDDDDSSDSGQDSSGNSSGGMDCPEEERCGEICCGDGEMCYAGQCYNDCGDGTPGCGDAPGECCASGDICYLDSCVTPGDACGAACPTSPSSSICGPDEVCDPALERCMPKGDSDECIFEPPQGTFDPVPLFTWGQRVQLPCTDGSECEKGEVCEDGMCTITWPHVEPGEGDLPDSVQSVAIPLVIDLDQDCVPEIVFISNSGTINGAANVRAIRGDNGSKVWTIDDAEYAVDASGNLAAGDIDGDGAPEIVGESSLKELVAFDSDGTPLWKSDPIVGRNSSGSVAIADLDGKGNPEIIFGANVFDSEGKNRWAGSEGIGGPNFITPISCVADLDGDDRPEIIGGNTAYSFTGDLEAGDFAGDVLWKSTASEGYCGIADFDDDGAPEVVLVVQGAQLVQVLSGQDGTVLATLPHPGGTWGGAPNIDDFNGDGRPDIGVASGNAYAVMEFDPEALELSVLWQAPTRDTSSSITGSSVFDFDGDGTAEVVYNDEDFFRIYPGVEPDCRLDPPGPDCDGIMTDDEVLLKELNSSHTRSEYPVVADVDGDYKAELVIVTNNWWDRWPNGDAGIEVWDDSLGNWVPSRAIWNQHSYHITNVNVDGTIPVDEPDSWASYNNYRSNSAGESNLCAPDLVPKGLFVDESQCSDIVASVWVQNRGCLGVGPGVKVAFFEENLGFLGVVETTGRLPAGAAEKVTLVKRGDEAGAVGDPPYTIHVIVDDDGFGQGEINECREDNNQSDPLRVCEFGPPVE